MTNPEERPYEPTLGDVMSALEKASDTIDFLLHHCAVAMARMSTNLEERPTDGELPEQGLLRTLSGLEVLTRAVGHLQTAEGNVRSIQAARDWDAARAESQAVMQ